MVFSLSTPHIEQYHTPITYYWHGSINIQECFIIFNYHITNKDSIDIITFWCSTMMYLNDFKRIFENIYPSWIFFPINSINAILSLCFFYFFLRVASEFSLYLPTNYHDFWNTVLRRMIIVDNNAQSIFWGKGRMASRQAFSV